MIICFDLDGTICTTDDKKNYNDAKLIPGMKEKINQLYASNFIKIFTARGASSGIDWTELTKKQLHYWGINYHELLMNQKPSYDLFVDDKAINAEQWRHQNLNKVSGIIAGAFDAVHPGYIKMFKMAKQVCSHLSIALHEDPSIERKKLKPILSVEDRIEILSSIKYIDDILVYKTENDLIQILKNNKFNIRFLGEDYKTNKITAPELTDEIYFIDRSHGWSTTEYKNKIYLSMKEKNESISNRP